MWNKTKKNPKLHWDNEVSKSLGSFKKNSQNPFAETSEMLIFIQISWADKKLFLIRKGKQTKESEESFLGLFR